MASTANSFECDYLRLHTPPILCAFSKEKAELIFLNEQITSLDNHISQLNTLLRAFHHRSRQLHNLLAPIHALPLEVLSCIFRQVIDSGNCGGLDFYYSPQRLRGAFILGSVSAHFRHAALGTPELWKRIPLHITDWKAIGKASSLLQHCMALAANVNVSVLDTLDEREARSAIDILLTPDTMQKVKAFELSGSRAPNIWVEKLKGSSFPMLDTLSIGYTEDLNIGTLKTVTRLIISNRCRGRVILPPSVRYLNVTNVSERELVSLLYQCPNLVECFAYACRYISGSLDDNAQFNEPFTLSHLKRLTFGAFDIIAMPLSAQNFRLPSLEFLRLDYPRNNAFIGVIPFCSNLSTTLTTLIINAEYVEFDGDNLYRLCKLPFRKLRRLEFWCVSFEPLRRSIHALAMLDGECYIPETCHLPALRSITLRCHAKNIEPHSIIDLLKEWRIGEAFYFHLVFEYPRRDHCWTLELDEWRSNIGNRKIEITWGSRKVQELCVQDGSL